MWRDCNAILNNGGNNIFWPAGTAQSCVNPLTFTNPLLSPLANNGGPTETMALNSGSPAINIASGCPPLDQRGFPRDRNCDSGSFGFQTVLAIISDRNVNSLTLYPNPTLDGKLTLEVPQDFRGKNIEIVVVNTLGMELKQFTNEGLKNSYLINLDTLPAGVYFVILKSGQKLYKGKIIKK